VCTTCMSKRAYMYLLMAVLDTLLEPCTCVYLMTLTALGKALPFTPCQSVHSSSATKLQRSFVSFSQVCPRDGLIAA
jgi:hypothetical protein